MTSQVLEDLRVAVEANSAVDQSAIELLNGIAGRVQAAVNAALENGATAAELAPVQDEVNALVASTAALAAAVSANT